jgi:hypothetical protein
MKNNSNTYSGDLKEYQLHGSTNPVMKLKREPHQYTFNTYQNLLYSRALKGLYAYDVEVRKKMHWDKKKRIKRIHKRAQECINLLKQDVINQWCDCLLGDVFKGGNATYMISSEEVAPDPEFVSTLELKYLGITKPMVIKKFVEQGILPRDFYELTHASKA